MDSEPDAIAIAVYADGLLPLATASLGQEYFCQSLPLCIIDTVFSIDVRYNGTRNVVARYCTYTHQRRIRVGKALPPTTELEAINMFYDRLEQANPAAMAQQVYSSRQGTSTTSGILNAEAVARFASCLQFHGVKYFQDIPKVIDSAPFKADIRAIAGQGRGISLPYF